MLAGSSICGGPDANERESEHTVTASDINARMSCSQAAAAVRASSYEATPGARSSAHPGSASVDRSVHRPQAQSRGTTSATISAKTSSSSSPGSLDGDPDRERSLQRYPRMVARLPAGYAQPEVTPRHLHVSQPRPVALQVLRGWFDTTARSQAKRTRPEESHFKLYGPRETSVASLQCGQPQFQVINHTPELDIDLA
jgi:hypothetical protein